MSAALAQSEMNPPAIAVPDAPEHGPAPAVVISSDQLRTLGQNLDRLFTQYESDRRIAELKWLKNLRQYLGIYDPEIEGQLGKNRSQAYPRITRVKVISTLSRIMNLMFPGNERNWELKASPSPDMDPADVMEAIQNAMKRNQEQGGDASAPLTEEDIEEAVEELACERAEELTELIDDQLQEIGGDQTQDYIAICRKVALSGIMYGMGVAVGPFARVAKKTVWKMGQPSMDPQTGQQYPGLPEPAVIEQYKPMYEFLPVWDFYPDMSAKTLGSMDGYFKRIVMTRSQVRALANRPDFFGDQIRKYLSRTQTGNFKAKPYESELRVMGVKIHVNEQKAETAKYEVLVWNGPVSGSALQMAGVQIPEGSEGDDIEAEVWLIEGNVIKADMNPWRRMGVDVRTIHTFLFDEDDTSPVGNGLPNVVRDSQMAISAAARMLMDNASVVCGPNVELNLDLLRSDQDITNIQPYKVWYREGMGIDGKNQAVRSISFDSHMTELLKIIELFMGFADQETFVGPATGGDMSKTPSEPMRTAAGASMLRGDAALPFKDIVRNYDFFTQSIITSLVQFNRKFNPTLAKAGDYNVIARGATSLIAKEVRGMQVDTLAASLTPGEMLHVDERKLAEARFKVRDLGDMLVSEAEAKRRKDAQDAQMQQQTDMQTKMLEAEIRKSLSDAFKNISQGQKNSAMADATSTTTALDVLERALNDGEAAKPQPKAKSAH